MLSLYEFLKIYTERLSAHNPATVISSLLQNLKERINRKTDQKIYQPRIHSKRIQELYYVKEMTGRPMTVLVDEAITLYLSDFSFLPKIISEAEQRTIAENTNSV